MTKDASSSRVKPGSAGRPKAGPSEPKASLALTTPRKPKQAAAFETPKSQRAVNPFASPAALSRSGASRDPATIAPSSARRPIHDPSPINPFASPSQSTYIYAESPRKFKALLEAGSAQKRAHGLGPGLEATPRTRARKRLRGEPVEDTPDKPKARGMERIASVGGAERSFPGARQTSGRGSAMSESDDEEDEDKALGPTPVKPAGNGTTAAAPVSPRDAGNGGRFQLFFDEAERNEPPSPLRGMGLFRKASEEAGLVRAEHTNGEVRAAASASLVARQAAEGAMEPSEDALADESPEEDQPMEYVSGEAGKPDSAGSSPITKPTELDPRMVPDELLAHDIDISSDEGGEDSAGEAGGPSTAGQGHGRTRVRIASSRLATQQRVAGRDRMTQRFGPRASPPPAARDGSPSAASKLAIAPTLDLASLALSPMSKVVRRTLALQESRAKAVFNPDVADKMRLAKHAPVWLPGEAEQEVGSDGEPMDAHDDSTADDDWDSDPEGWKATGLPDEEDW